MKVRSDNLLQIRLIALYACTAGVGAVFNTFIPVYFKQIGLNGTMIGTLLAISPLMILIGQPFWGTAGDRTRSVNRLFRWIMGGTAVSVIGFVLTRDFTVLLIISCVYGFFTSAMYSMQDVLVLQAIEHTPVRYGTARMGSTVGFAVISVLAGLAADWRIEVIFPLTAAFAILSLLSTFRLPAVRGHQTREHRVSPLVLLKNRELVILTVLSFFVILTFGYYSSFFSIYFSDLGGDGKLLGIYWFISAIIEVPFLFFAERIVRRLGLRATLILAATAMGVRWLMIFVLQNVYAVMATGLLHGLSFIVVIYCMATFINREVPAELKSSGQSFYALIGGGLPRILASVLGGVANDAFGIRPMFLVCAIINLLTVVVIGGLFLRSRRRVMTLAESDLKQV